MDRDEPKPLEWIASSKNDLMGFPGAVRDHVGYALYLAQIGLKHRDAKPLKHLGSGVLEVVSRHDGGTYRSVYVVRFTKAVYVLHAFEKTSKKGIATPKREIDLIMRRLAMAERHYRQTHG